MVEQVRQYDVEHVRLPLAIGLLNEAKGNVISAKTYLSEKIERLIRHDAADTGANALTLLNKYEGSVTNSLNEYQSGLAIIQICTEGISKKTVREFYISYNYDPTKAIEALNRVQKKDTDQLDTTTVGGDPCYICRCPFTKTGPNRKGSGICSRNCRESRNLCHSCNQKWWTSTWGRTSGCPYCRSPLKWS